MQEIDAQRRLAILRGEAPPPIEDVEPPKAHESPAGSAPGASHSGGMRRKRKRPDEDDTQFELRIAREKNELAVTTLEPERKATSTAPIVDHAGHIDLLGDAKLRAHAEKNEEAEKEAKKNKQSFEDQYTMRFSNAAGRDGISNPWYSQSEPTAQEAPLKNVWGREDPQRRERDTKRIVASDPLAMMKQGASKVRELKKERKQFQEEQAGQLKQLSREERRREERHREKRRRGHEEREERRDKDGSSRRSDHRHRSRERRHHDKDGHDRDESKDRRKKRHEHHDDRDESRNDKSRERRREGDERHRRRGSRSPARDDSGRHRRYRSRD